MKKPSDRNAVLIHRIINTMANSTIAVFLPVLILKMTGSLALTILYLVVRYVTGGLFSVCLLKLFKKCAMLLICLSIIPLIAIQVLIVLAPMNVGIIILTACCTSLSSAMYYIPLNAIFALTDKKVDVSKFQISSILGKIVFTLASAFMIGVGDSSSLAIVAGVTIALCLLSLVPFINKYKRLNDVMKKEEACSLKQVSVKFTKYNICHWFLGMFSSVINDILPIYLFFYSLNVQTVGILLVAIELGKMASNLMAKRLSKKDKDEIGYIICFVIFVSSCVLIPLINNSILLFILSSVIGLSFPFIFVPLFRMYCKDAENINSVQTAMVLREANLLTPRGIMLSIFFLIPNLTVFFVVGGASCCFLIYLANNITKRYRIDYANRKKLLAESLANTVVIDNNENNTQSEEK